MGERVATDLVASKVANSIAGEDCDAASDAPAFAGALPMLVVAFFVAFGIGAKRSRARGVIGSRLSSARREIDGDAVWRAIRAKGGPDGR